jgi:hypothetical protein
MRRRASILWVSVAVLIVLFTPGHATQVIYQTPKQLADESSQIVRGKVMSVRSYWNAERTLIFTQVRVKVDETYKGRTLPEASIVQLGGVVDHMRLTVDGALSWKPAEEVLLFLEPNPAGDYQVAGFSQGKFAIERDARTGRAFVKSAGLAGPTLVGAPPGSAGAAKTPLDQFITKTVGLK